jgi:hypothetical protein
MNPAIIREQVDYWLAESEESLETARILHDKKRYLESAFF